MIIDNLSTILASGDLKGISKGKKFQYFFSCPDRFLAKRIFVFIVEQNHHKPTYVAKIALDQNSANYFKNAFENINYLYKKFNKHPLLFAVPSQKYIGSINHYTILIEEFLDGDKAEIIFSNRSVKRLTNLFLDWLIEFSNMTKKYVEIDDPFIKNEFENRFDIFFKKLDGSLTLKSFLENQLNEVRKNINKKVPVFFCHGDFAVRNFILNDGRLRAVDWEYSKKMSLALLDIFHLCAMNVWQLEKCNYEKCITKAFFRYGKYNDLVSPIINRYLSELEIEPKNLLPYFIAYLSDWVENAKSVTLDVMKIMEEIINNKNKLKFI